MMPSEVVAKFGLFPVVGRAGQSLVEVSERAEEGLILVV